MPLPAPPVGTIENGHKFLGGNPGDDNSWQPLSGTDFLKTLPLGRQNLIKGILQARAPFPNARAGKADAFTNQLMTDVAQTEPGFDATTYKQRQNAKLDFTSGKTAAIIRALNQAPLHAVQLSKAYDALNNTDYSPINNLLTNTQAALGDKRQQGARGSFNEVQPALSGELATTYKGGYATIPDIQAQEKAFSMSAAPTESNAALSQASDLMGDRLTQLNQQWQNAMGPTADPFPVIGPKAQEALTYLKGRYKPQPKADSGKAPDGVDAATWSHMTPQERSLWQK